MPLDSESVGMANLTFNKRKALSIGKQLFDIKLELSALYLSSLDESSIQARLEFNERLFQQFDEAQTKLEEENHDEFDSGDRSDVSSVFLGNKSLLHRELTARRSAGLSHSSTVRHFSPEESHPSFILAQPKTRLPALQIPTFSGGYTEWPDFISMFESVVGKDSDLSKIEKFQHLRSSLKGPALDTVRSLEITENNYDQAISLLRHRFDNKRLTFQAHIREIFGLKNVEAGSVFKLRQLSDKVNSHLRALQTMGNKEQIADCLLIHLIGSKLDSASQSKWEEKTPTSQIPTWDAMSTFLENRCRILENALVPMTPGKQVGKALYQNINNTRRALVASSFSSYNCSLCKSDDHLLSDCTSFLNLSPACRLREAKKLKLCLNCLKRGHWLNACQSTRCHHCSSKHHTLLHISPLTISNEQPSPSDNVSASMNISQASLDIFSQPTASNIQSSLVGNIPSAVDNSQAALISMSASSRVETKTQLDSFVLLATAVVFVKNRVGSLVPCRIILDSASQLNFVTSRFSNQLQLRRTKSPTVISGIGESDFVADSVVDLFMQSQFGDYSTTIVAVVTPTITDQQPSFNINTSGWNIPNNIMLADPLFYKSQRVDALVGAGLFFDLICIGQIRIRDDLPLMQKTRLGWVVSGVGHHMSTKYSAIAVIDKTPIAYDSDYFLHEIVKTFWEVENIVHSELKMTKEELECENHFKSNYKRMVTGEYSVRLPLKFNPAILGDSYTQALIRFKGLEKKLDRNPELKKQYSSFIQEYLELNHMSEVGRVEDGIKTNFLPHHCVLKADSSTTKLRVVFDGSAASSNGRSLNDILMTGPCIQQKLFDILLRFRSFKIALTGDICKMYRCVRVNQPDSYLQCILWRDTPHEKVKIFKLDTVTYGTKPASFLAIRSMHQLAHDEKNKYPLAAETVCRDFYVDDMITGENSVEKAREIMQQTTELLSLGNFKIRKWCSNSTQLLDAVSEKDKETFLTFNDGTDVTKILGLIWNPQNDDFLFSFSPPPLARVTKRSVLSTIARFYDPLGLIGPVIAKAKIFLQILWRDKFEWDESLPQVLHSAWTELLAELTDVGNPSFPRLVFFPFSMLEVHAFCDASSAAYGACVYVRSEYKGNITSNLLCSKSRVAPLKTLTIPKLELSAALLLAELVCVIKKLEIFNCEFHCWTDSTVVLSWLREEQSNFNIFVANRVSNILQLTSDMNWHYVPTLQNPADILSRGSSPRALIDSTLWKHGPVFLQGSRDDWPAFPGLVHDLPERRKKVLIVSSNTKDLSLDCKFINSFGKMQRIYAYVYKFGTRGTSRFGLLTAIDIKLGTQLLIRMVQRASFYAEFKALEKGQQVSTSSSLYSLSPFLDSFGLLRVGGRLKHSLLDFDARHPIVLPKGHPLTKSIVDYYHKKFMHAGPQSLLASLRLQYWPIGGRKTLNRIVSMCVRCFHTQPRLAQHIMGDLPAERVQASRAFLITGVDFCGPFFYQSEVRNKSPIKSYICLFICFSTKALHMELVKDLSTPSFLAALKRFICTRGRPKCIWSDNATNFVGAKNELAELRRLFSSNTHQEAVKEQCLEDSIDWKFIPPRSPHFGGLWEASVKLAKFHFYRVVGLSVLNFEELRTLVCQISAIINSRPLHPLTENPDDLEVLTPAHFLVGAPFTSIVEPDVTHLNLNRMGRWQRVCCMQQHFWRKWSTEYLTLLQQRSKWRSSQENIKVGTMVLLKEENLPPLKWQMGRITETISGDDGVVRVTLVKTSSGIVKRATGKLCILPKEDDGVESVSLPTG